MAGQTPCLVALEEAWEHEPGLGAVPSPHSWHLQEHPTWPPAAQHPAPAWSSTGHPTPSGTAPVPGVEPQPLLPACGSEPTKATTPCTPAAGTDSTRASVLRSHSSRSVPFADTRYGSKAATRPWDQLGARVTACRLVRLSARRPARQRDSSSLGSAGTPRGPPPAPTTHSYGRDLIAEDRVHPTSTPLPRQGPAACRARLATPAHSNHLCCLLQTPPGLTQG